MIKFTEYFMYASAYKRFFDCIFPGEDEVCDLNMVYGRDIDMSDYQACESRIIAAVSACYIPDFAKSSNVEISGSNVFVSIDDMPYVYSMLFLHNKVNVKSEYSSIFPKAEPPLKEGYCQVVEHLKSMFNVKCSMHIPEGTCGIGGGNYYFLSYKGIYATIYTNRECDLISGGLYIFVRPEMGMCLLEDIGWRVVSLQDEKYQGVSYMYYPADMLKPNLVSDLLQITYEVLELDGIYLDSLESDYINLIPELVYCPLNIHSIAALCKSMGCANEFANMPFICRDLLVSSINEYQRDIILNTLSSPSYSNYKSMSRLQEAGGTNAMTVYSGICKMIEDLWEV